MSTFLDSVKTLRSDLSEWLIHFTKGTDEVASKTLTTILSESSLRSFTHPYAICFSEAPLIELNKLFQLYRKYPEPRYAPFGIAVRKDWFFERQGRHAIYSPENEFKFVKDEQKYRLVKHSPPDHDFSWQREWRVDSKEFKIDAENALVIVPTEDAAHGLTYDVDVDYEYEGPGETSMHAWIERSWYSLALDSLPTTSGSSDSVIANLISAQEIKPKEAEQGDAPKP